jgi:hypothetical protein
VSHVGGELKNAIVILIRNDWRDIVDLNECLVSITQNIPESLEDTDFLFYHEDGFDEYKQGIDLPEMMKSRTTFHLVDLMPPSDLQFSKPISIPEYVPHPTHSNGPIGFGHPGFSLGYRGMCRFFGATIFTRSEIAHYSYIMRLDTDSRFLKGNGESLFRWAEENNVVYGFIKSANQWDHIDLFKGLKFHSLLYFLKSGNVIAFVRAIFTRRGRVYYTNFELNQVKYFASSQWQNYFNYLDRTGGFYTRRWGDHILRYMGVNSLVKRKFRRSLKAGYTYQHGGVFNSSERQSWRPRWIAH